MNTKPQIIATDLIPDRLRAPVIALCNVANNLSITIARGALGQTLGAAVGINSDGDGQKALDVMADEEFAEALKGTSVRWYASEEQEEVVGIDGDGAFALAIDPLDGSSNIDVNVSIGTLFSIFEAKDDPNESFLRPADEQIAVGYFIYGPQTALVITFGSGTLYFILDPTTRTFTLVDILSQSAKTLHGRTPLVFGSADKVTRIAAYHDLPENEVSALFGSEGLFRN